MKIAAAEALAELAREDVPDEVDRRLFRPPPALWAGIPHPGAVRPAPDLAVPSAVAQAAMDTGVARRPIADMARYRQALTGRLDPTASWMQPVRAGQGQPERVVFAEGEEERSHPRRHRLPRQRLRHADPDRPRGADPRDHAAASASTDTEGSRSTMRGCRRTTRPTPTSSTSACSATGSCCRDCSAWSTRAATCSAPAWWRMGDADAHGHRHHPPLPRRARGRAAGDRRRGRAGARSGYSIMVPRQGTVFIADTAVNETPTPEQLADIAMQMAANARTHGPRPRVALLSFSQFRQPRGRAHRPHPRRGPHPRRREVDFEYDGEMAGRRGARPRADEATYPFCRLTGPANVLIMPALHSAHISSQAAAAAGRRHGDRPAARSASPSRCRSSRWAPPSPTSSTSPRSPPMARSAERDRP